MEESSSSSAAAGGSATSAVVDAILRGIAAARFLLVMDAVEEGAKAVATRPPVRNARVARNVADMVNFILWILMGCFGVGCKWLEQTV